MHPLLFMLGVTLGWATPDMPSKVIPDHQTSDPTPWAYPRDVLIIGSSTMEHGFGPALGDALVAMGAERRIVRARYATSLSRQDYFDWLGAADTLAESHPDLTLIMFGGNDGQACLSPDKRVAIAYGSERWDDEYQRRIRQLIETFQGVGSHVVVFGYAHPTRERFDVKVEHINALTREAVAGTGAMYLSLWDWTTNASGAPILTHTDGETTRKMHQRDGIHINMDVSRLLAADMAEELVTYFGPPPDCQHGPEDAPAIACERWGPPLLPLRRVPRLEWPVKKKKEEEPDASMSTDAPAADDATPELARDDTPAPEATVGDSEGTTTAE